MKGTITPEKNSNRNNEEYNKPFVFKNDDLFINCISKINGALIDYVEDLDVVICLCTVWLNIELSLWNYYRDEPDNDG